MLSIRSTFRSQLRLSSVTLSSLCYSSSSAAAIQAEKTIKDGPRNDWTRQEIKDVYDSPLLDLLFHGVSSFYLVMQGKGFSYAGVNVLCCFVLLGSSS
jgi:hypothetical protein